MSRVLGLLIIGAMALSQSLAGSAQSMPANPHSELIAASDSGDLPELPAVPQGKSTIMGGEIRSIDPVSDKLLLNITGQKPMQILYDERTQVYRDGKKISLRDLAPVDHASVQTILDGSNVYALSIHMLSHSPEGEFQGRVLSFNPTTGELTMSSVLAREPIRLLVPESTAVVRVGQPTFSSFHLGHSDLVSGALISVQFEAGKDGRAVADHISVLARPGSAFVFNGSVTALDMHSGVLAMFDPLDEKTYTISFDPHRVSISQNLRLGDRIIVTADFSGSGYVASQIAINN